MWTKDVDFWMVVARVDGKQRGITQTRLKHYLNQQKDLDLGHKLNTTDFETEICKVYGADGCRTGNLVDYGTKAKTLELRVRCESDGIPKALDTT
jgi:hypothetical protein